jgi:hypothetical protein
MSTSLSIKIEDQSFSAELNDSPAAARLLEDLPLKLRMSRWGEEFYGDCGVSIPTDAGARELLEVGEIAYWPPGCALCFFFGPTPASTDERPRAASAVVPLGRFKGGVDALRSFGSSIEVELAREPE